MLKNKYVWDASALIAAINSDERCHSQTYNFFRDNETAIYIFPVIAWMEYQAIQSRKEKNGSKAYRDMYLLDEKNVVYDINQELIVRISSNKLHEKFLLRGMDLIYASIAFLEDASLVTLDKDFKKISDHVDLVFPDEL